MSVLASISTLPVPLVSNVISELVSSPLIRLSLISNSGVSTLPYCTTASAPVGEIIIGPTVDVTVPEVFKIMLSMVAAVPVTNMFVLILDDPVMSKASVGGLVLIPILALLTSRYSRSASTGPFLKVRGVPFLTRLSDSSLPLILPSCATNGSDIGSLQ